MRLALVDSSVPATLTPALAEGLGLAPGFLAEAERLGLFLRAHASGARSYHPLFRAFLLERLHRPAHRARARRSSTPASAASAGRVRPPRRGDRPLAGRRPLPRGARGARDPRPGARADLARHGRRLARALPAPVRSRPRLPVPRGAAAVGRRPARASARAAARGRVRLPRARHVEREWLARVVPRRRPDLGGCVRRADRPRGGLGGRPRRAGASAAVAVAWYHAIALFIRGLPDEAEALAERLRADPATAAQFRLPRRHRSGSSTSPPRAAAGPRSRGCTPRSRSSSGTTRTGGCRTRSRWRCSCCGTSASARPRSSASIAASASPNGSAWASWRATASSSARSSWPRRRSCRAPRSSSPARAGAAARDGAACTASWPRRTWRRCAATARQAVAAAQRALERIAPGAVCCSRLGRGGPGPAAGGERRAGRRTRRDRRHAGRPRRALPRRARSPPPRAPAGRACVPRVRRRRAGCGVRERQALLGRGRRRGRPGGARALANAPARAVARARGGGDRARRRASRASRARSPAARRSWRWSTTPTRRVRRAALLTALAAGHPAVLARLAALEKDPDEQVASAAAVAARAPAHRTLRRCGSSCSAAST